MGRNGAINSGNSPGSSQGEVVYSAKERRTRQHGPFPLLLALAEETVAKEFSKLCPLEESPVP